MAVYCEVSLSKTGIVGELGRNLSSEFSMFSGLQTSTFYLLGRPDVFLLLMRDAASFTDTICNED